MKVALYARVSSEQQAEKDLSIPAQLKALKTHALKRGWDVAIEFVDCGNCPAKRADAVRRDFCKTVRGNRHGLCRRFAKHLKRRQHHAPKGIFEFFHPAH